MNYEFWKCDKHKYTGNTEMGCPDCAGKETKSRTSPKQPVNRENWKKLYRKMTTGTPRDREVEAFIEELMRSVDGEEANKD